MIKTLLRSELLKEAEKSKIILYHGSDNDITTFSDEFAGKDEATDSEGPGIYLTNIYNDARQYGNIIYTVEINPRKLLLQTPISKVKYNIGGTMKKLMKMKEDWEYNAQDWDENPEIGLNKSIKAILEYEDNEKDAFLQIWIDYYRRRETEYMRNMVSLGIDGIMVEKKDFERYEGFKGCKHFIIYNPSIIKINNIERNNR